MKFLSYLLCILLIPLAVVCDREEFEQCDCAVQYFAENPDEPGSFILEKEVREARVCETIGDTLYLSPVSGEYVYDCK